MPPAGIPPSRALPSKESSLFKEVLHYYEDRQLKKGLKTADTILKKFPNHGETLCMKGLILTHLGRRDEGLELVKQGVRLDLTSHICWHVFGLIQKGQKNYEEALKSYTQALRFDKDNMNILRDAAHLQTQLRLYDSLVETRHTLLRLRPQLRQNWIALAVAYHLSGNLKEAKAVLEQYERIIKNVPDYDVEFSEILLYHVRVLEDLGDYAEAITLLDASAKARTIIDRVAIMEFRARILSKAGKEEAQQAWQGLIEQNPECYDYFKGFLSSRDIDFGKCCHDENRSKALQSLKDFSEQFSKASAPRRLALDIALGDDFKGLLEPFLRTRLEKGVPSLFADLKSLYRSPEKREIIEALELLDEAITHTPTLPELYMLKARVLKRAGDPFGAAKAMDLARTLDLQDRFLNTKCGKYRLRAGLLEEAVEVFGLFTKKDAPSPSQDLEDMQSLVYLTEEADAHLRNGNLAMALKKYDCYPQVLTLVCVQQVFDIYEDDQFDFHGYSVRKFTINIYLNLLQWEDNLRSHPAYVHSAIEASRVSVQLGMWRYRTELSKKAKKKAKKAEKKVQEEAKKANNAANEDKGLDVSPSKDEDPDGTKLLQSPDPLERAAKMLKPLATLAKANIEAWIAIYDVAIRRKKYLQAIHALNSAHSLDADSPELHVRVVDFKRRWTSLEQKPSDAVATAASTAIAKLLPDEVSLEAFNSQYFQRHSSRADAILAAAQVSRILGAPREEVEAAVFNALNADVDLKLETALSTVALLNEIQSPRADEFREACRGKFELSTLLLPADELAAARKAVIQKDPVAEAIDEKAEVIS
ncbi:N-terminal acetyltransferase A, auxiliary subunit [Cerioporus squamosus]|nr:N-terminal acetyltransferase A, auxiliary subunit [Cerioporus squamosus]